jgi:DNA (cytosine-5)-methyltransferase 1
MRKRKPKFLRTVRVGQTKSSATVISLFSGCGGMDLGFRMAGWEIRVMIDNEDACCQTLHANFTRAGWRRNGGGRFPKWMQKREPVILCRDIKQTSTAMLLEAADLQVGECGAVTGGFPCQGFSFSGKRQLWDPRNVLYKECVRVVREALPKYFVFENVPGLISMARGQVINQICRELAGCGYDVQWDVLNAADYGVPQDRRRIFFIGVRNDAMFFPAHGNPQLYMGTGGRYKHPDSFTKKYGIPSHWPTPEPSEAIQSPPKAQK